MTFQATKGSMNLTMEYVKLALWMYDQNISELNEEKFFSFFLTDG